MEIESVELLYLTEDESGTPNMLIHWKGVTETTAFVATATDNRHYHEVKEWYKAQKKKPFKFDFE